MSDELAFVQELQKEFLDEATFYLEQCEESYLKLEAPEHREEELTKIFRCAHSMKGAGAAVGFMDLAGFAHVVEDCLALLRLHPDLITPEVTSILLRSGDALKLRVDQLKAKSQDPWDIAALTEEVKALAKSLSANANGSTTKETVVAENRAPGDPFTAEEFDALLAAETSKQLIKPAEATPPVAPAAEAAAVEAPPVTAAPTPQAPAASGQAGGGAQGSSTVKIDTGRIDAVLDLIGELVVIKSQLIDSTTPYNHDLRLNAVVSLLDKTVRELQGSALNMRLTSLKPLFLKTQRVVRDLTLKLSKPVEFEMHGEDTEIDRTMIELLSDPLLHLVRNSIDHGIEDAETRKAKGKPEKGTISVTATQTGSRIVVEVKDDGGGINRERVLAKALERNIVPAGKDPQKLTDEEVFSFIFAPGFSTAAVVSDVSGRGVGLDVVKSNIEKLKGTINISSKPDTGTSFRVAIPLTTSIIDGMLVTVNNHPYILPMDHIRELVNTEGLSVTEMSPQKRVVQIRGKVHPIINLEEILEATYEELTGETRKIPTGPRANRTVIVTEQSSGPVAMQVQNVIGQSQVVLKTLGSAFQNTDGVAGAAILGDGTVALVLDVDGLVRKAA